MKPLRFIHTADLHLGSPLKSIGEVSGELQEQLHNATFTALRQIVSAAIELEVDFVLIAGDLYDLESRSIRANRIVAQQLRRLDEAGINAYLIAGNHDPLTREGADAFDLPKNAHVFGTETEICEYSRDGEVVARILGQSYRSSSEPRKMYSGFTPPDASVWNIGMLHTALDPNNTRYVPCHPDDLASKQEIHYWALGHVHQQRVVQSGEQPIVYPGNPQGRDTGETGINGCVLVEMTPGEEPDISTIPTSSIIWDIKDISIDPGDSEPPESIDALLDQFRSAIEDMPDENYIDEPILPAHPNFEDEYRIDGHIIRWHVTGKGPLHDELAKNREEAGETITEVLREEFGQMSPFVWTESVRIRTGKPVPPIEELAGNSELFSDIRKIMDEFSSGEPSVDFDDILGKIWDTSGDYENMNPERFVAGQRDIEGFIEEAGQRIVESILERRDDS
ncbi:MAG: DNA repair exonuclease [Candidatus Marinimicrobia bacterium]|nr:DNA repair exonuclease [Candidatus Neomarinimicrobiota bacterium]MCF7828161.1 DNA repair exonuclease [Candidatus Neomarinimicrobiota bacterium]MCF7879664.1 DNA repair exonuclease [Candidatus Neomarinimicrobiota bacterium]